MNLNDYENATLCAHEIAVLTLSPPEYFDMHNHRGGADSARR